MRRDRGITLIELIVAMALFALVAVMGLQALNGMLRSRDRLSGMADETERLSTALALLRHDLGSAVPVLFHTPEGLPESALGVTSPGPVLSLSLGGQATLETPDFTAFHRVEWRFDAAARRLTRQVWPTLQPARRDQLSPPVPALEGVTGLGLRLYDDGIGWTDWTELPADRISTQLPDAVEVTIVTARFGPITLVEAYR